jgi:hypothetical protein
MVDRKRREINALETANIDCGHAIAGRIGTFAIRMDAASRAEVMPDDVLVKCVGAYLVLGRKQSHLVPWNEPKKRSLSRADGTIAIHHLGEFPFDLISDLSAVTAAFVNH